MLSTYFPLLYSVWPFMMDMLKKNIILQAISKISSACIGSKFTPSHHLNKMIFQLFFKIQKLSKSIFSNMYISTCQTRHADTTSLKPVIHYSRTRQIGNEVFFWWNKILFAKRRQTCCYTLFLVRCQFSHEHIRHWEHLCVCRRDRYPDANTANIVQ